MIRAVIFDCFGVLTYDGWLPFKKKYFSDDQDLQEQATDLGTRVNRGHLDYGNFIKEIAELAQVPAEEAREAIHDNVPNEELFEYIENDLKPRYKLGLLSNAGRNMLDEIFPKEKLAAFDAIALSYETGHLKPSTKAYETIASRLGVEPASCVFIDDQERYCTAAKEFGMQTVWYRDFEQMKRELIELLRDSKN